MNTEDQDKNSDRSAAANAVALPRAWGVSRDAESPGCKGVLVSFERKLSDDELRGLHDLLSKGGAV